LKKNNLNYSFQIPKILKNMSISKLFSTHHLPILLSNDDTEQGSRMGGRIPSCIQGDTNCPVCQGPVEYLLTLAPDTLGQEISQDKEISMFVCKDFDCRWSGQRVVHPSPLIFIVHDASTRNNEITLMDSPSDGLGLIAGPLTLDPVENGFVTMEHTKIGGGPGWIQGWGKGETEKITEQGYIFLFQYTEPVYPDHKMPGADPFGFGTAYVFGKKQTGSNLPSLNEVVAFWQKT
jgi:hypothetical protein